MSDPVIDIVYDPCVALALQPAADTTAEELRSIDDATRMWNDIAGFPIARNELGSEQTLPIRFEQAALIFRGVYQDEIGDVIINRRLTNFKERSITVAHELGHALGLPHIDTRPSVMNSGNLTVQPLAEDVTALTAIWGPCPQDAATTVP